MTELEFLAYAVVKFAAYASWCGLGARRIAHRSPLWPALGLGFIRLLMGLGFGIVIFLGVNVVHGEVAVLPFAEVISYFAVYVPVRVIEWGIILMILIRMQRGAPSSRRANIGWIAGGIAISCAADIPILLGVDGLPIGRVLC